MEVFEKAAENYVKHCEEVLRKLEEENELRKKAERKCEDLRNVLVNISTDKI